MSQVSRISKLPVLVQREIEERIVTNGFGGYVALDADLRGRGYRVSKSALHRFGKALKSIQSKADQDALLARARARARRKATA